LACQSCYNPREFMLGSANYHGNWVGGCEVILSTIKLVYIKRFLYRKKVSGLSAIQGININ